MKPFEIDLSKAEEPETPAMSSGMKLISTAMRKRSQYLITKALEGTENTVPDYQRSLRQRQIGIADNIYAEIPETYR
jgi:hypothetical protein